MPALVPLPLSGLVTRAFEELERNRSIFDLPARKFVLGDSHHDTSVEFHGVRASAPLGPAAGPHTQMAQNIVLAWLAGARILELKTVQINDSLTIARPCIDARTVGYNIEWSQELKLEESLEEYVKASMLIEMLSASGALPIQPAFNRTIFDVSVGYDLEGIRSERVVTFLRGMLDARGTIEKLRHQIPRRWGRLRDLGFNHKIASTVTLSTFHGCPVAEIERIVDFLMTEMGVDCVVKLNPMLLGPEEVTAILHDRLGYTDIEVPPSAFERDAKWDEAVEIVERLRNRAVGLGRSFGIKLTNTLIVNNRGDFLPASEKLSYLSGPPLHVLAMHLVRRFRHTFGDAVPISFSAGIDRFNYPDAVSLGLVPVTVCTDLLKQGGYGRMQSYAVELTRRMHEVEALSIGDFILRARGEGDLTLDALCLPAVETEVCRAELRRGGRLDRAIEPELYRRWVAEAKIANTERYVDSLEKDARYGSERTARPARKTGHPLTLFDCATCDLCIPACPNDAISQLPALESQIARRELVRHDGAWKVEETGRLVLTKAHQIATYVDLCNDCGNCEVFCPDSGAPNELKVRIYGSEETWLSDPLDGFFLERREGRDHVLGRIDGAKYSLDIEGRDATYSGDSFQVVLRASGGESTDDAGGPVTPVLDAEREITATFAGNMPDRVDLWPVELMDFVRRATFHPFHVNYVNSRSPEGAHAS